jgi:predicted dehydrogenase
MSEPSSQTTLKIAIIGTGAIFRNHLEAYRALDNVEIVAVCDVNEELAIRTAQEYDIPRAFSSVTELLAAANDATDLGQLDVVSVCTPHPTHEAVVTEAAEAGVHVLCEKPLAISVESSQRMVEVCHRHGVKLGVLFQRRFWPAAQRIKALVEDGTIGQPILGHVSVMLHRDSSYYSATPWRGSWDSDGGGVLMTQGIHYIDLLLWLMGEVVEVHGHVNTFVHQEHMETEDSATATLKFASGAMATVQASTAVTPGLGVQIRITGTSGTSVQLTEFPEGTEGRIDVFGTGQTLETEPTWPAGAKPNTPLSEINAALVPFHKLQVADFVDAVITDTEPAVTGEEATKALRVLLAIYESSKTGKPVKL